MTSMTHHRWEDPSRNENHHHHHPVVMGDDQSPTVPVMTRILTEEEETTVDEVPVVVGTAGDDSLIDSSVPDLQDLLPPQETEETVESSNTTTMDAIATTPNDQEEEEEEEEEQGVPPPIGKQGSGNEMVDSVPQPELSDEEEVIGELADGTPIIPPDTTTSTSTTTTSTSSGNTGDVDYVDGELPFQGESGDMEMPIEVLNTTTGANDNDTDPIMDGSSSSYNNNADSNSNGVDTKDPPVTPDTGNGNDDNEDHTDISSTENDTPTENNPTETTIDALEESSVTQPQGGGDDVMDISTQSGGGNDSDVEQHVPVAAPVAAPSIPQWNNDAAPVVSLPEAHANATLPSFHHHSLGFFAAISLLPLFLLCLCRRYCCRRSSSADSRGDYRAVAARYGDMSFDNTFSDAFSEEELLEAGASPEEDEQGDIEESWSKSGQRVLEMSKMGMNGDTLSLEEMNG